MNLVAVEGMPCGKAKCDLHFGQELISHAWCLLHFGECNS